MKRANPKVSGVFGGILLAAGIGTFGFPGYKFGSVAAILAGACGVAYWAYVSITGRTAEELEEDEALDKRERRTKAEETRIGRERSREARKKELSERESKLREERAGSRSKKQGESS